MSGLIAELKRRNVIRVGIAYAVGSWLLVQAADLVFDLIGADDWVLRALAATLALGFIPAVLFAWAFELTPEGIKKEKDVDRTHSVTQHTAKKLDIATMVLLVAAIALLALDRFVPSGSESNLREDAQIASVADEDLTLTPNIPAAEHNQKSIAVLPFANRSNQNDDLYFTDGIHDDLLTQLAKVGDLTVISRTSVMEYRDSPKNLKQIAEELKVATILEGGVQKVGNRVRINAQLIEAATDKHLWAETFDRELTAENIFELQSEIARKIVTAVSGQLTPEEEQLLAEVPTQDLAAYEAYLRAREMVYGANYARSQEAAAQPLIEKAIALDPNYADAQALMAVIYSQLYWRGIDTSPALLAKYRATLDKAIALNPDSPRALRAKANYHYRVENDYAKSLELLNQAALKAPGNVDIQGDLGLTQRRLGRFDESIESFRHALRLDPANRFYHGLMLETMASRSRWQDIIDNTVPLKDADPDDLDSQATRAVALLNLTGDLQPLKQVFEHMNLTGSTQYSSWSAAVHLFMRDADKAIEILDGPLWASMLEEGITEATHLRQLAIAWRLKGDAERAREYDLKLVGLLDEKMQSALQEQVYGGCDIAEAMAWLGRHEEALALMNGLMEQVPLERDAMLWGSLIERRALVRAMAGDEAGAIEDLKVALETPTAFPITAWQLHYDPAWDFFRHNERFNELVSPSNLIQTKSL